MTIIEKNKADIRISELEDKIFAVSCEVSISTGPNLWSTWLTELEQELEALLKKVEEEL